MECKYKVWDKVNKKIYDCEKLYFKDGKITHAGIDCEGLKDEFQVIDIKLVELLPCTGLVDTNCNEIYEKYIVKINGKLYTIKYEIGSFMLVKVNEETDMYEEFKNYWNDNVYPLSQLYWENDCEENYIYELEIVGNIFENKNLLEG